MVGEQASGGTAAASSLTRTSGGAPASVAPTGATLDGPIRKAALTVVSAAPGTVVAACWLAGAGSCSLPVARQPAKEHCARPQSNAAATEPRAPQRDGVPEQLFTIQE